MGSNFHGKTTYRCHDDCRMEGCPGHRIALFSKHGGYFVIYLNEAGEPVGNNGNKTDIGSIGLIDAVAEILGRVQTGAQP